MNKPLAQSIPFLLLSVLSSACSNTQNAEIVNHLINNEIQPAVAKQAPKMHRHSLPEGVISLDIVNNNNRLHLLTGNHQQGDKALSYQYSDNDGQSWSPAVKILHDKLAVNMSRGKDAQITAQGDTVLVTWMQYAEGVRFNAGPMQAARSEDGGQTWTSVTAPPTWKQGPHGYFDLAADANAMHAVWLDSRVKHEDIKASQAMHYARSEDGGLSWQEDMTLDQVTCSCCWNTVKVDNNGNAYVLYRDKQPSDMAIGVIDPQQHWQRLNSVGAFDWQFEGCPHIGGGLDFQHSTDQQHIHAVVGSGHPEHLGIHYLHSNDQGHYWSAPKQLGDESAQHADVASHDDGRVTAVWDMMGEHGLAVFVAQSSDGGQTWSEAWQLSGTNARASHPRIVKTASGFLALWTESDGHQQIWASERL